MRMYARYRGERNGDELNYYYMTRKQLLEIES